MPNLDRRHPNAALALADGTVFLGFGGGCPGIHVGELVFNTAITGYQEILTDPSYAGQIVTFTFPHIGNVGVNDEDVEALTPYARGMVARGSDHRPVQLAQRRPSRDWLDSRGIAAIAGVDTRRITRILREGGAQNAALAYLPDAELDLDDLKARARACPSLEGMDLAGRGLRPPALRLGRDPLAAGARAMAAATAKARTSSRSTTASSATSCAASRAWAAGSRWCPPRPPPRKCWRWRRTASSSPTARATRRPPAIYAVPEIRKLVDSGKPVFGICLGHQMLGPGAGRRAPRRCPSAITAPTTRSRT